MGNSGLSKEDLNVILSGYRNRNLSEYVLKTAEADLKSGLSKKQVDLYTCRRLPDEIVGAMSGALHMGASAKLVRKLANLDEYGVKIVLAEIRGGMSEDKILNVLSKKATAHGMQQLFSQIKVDMANTEEKKEPDKPKETDKKEEPHKKHDADVSYKPEDIAKAMEPMFMKFTEGLSAALRPNLEYMNRMADSMNAMQARIAEDRGKAEESRLNEELDRLEKQVRELQNDLASSAGVIKNKETEIGRLKEEMAMMKDSNGQSSVVPAGRVQKPAWNTGKETGDENAGVGSSGKDRYGQDTSGQHVPDDRIHTETVRNEKPAGVTDHKADPVSGKKPVIMGDCQTVLRAPDGTEIPVQIERTEARRPKGMIAMAAKLFNGTQSQQALLRMLIDKRLTPEQLKEIKRAKDSHFTDDELTDLIESDLPAEEMAGIIDVIVSDGKQVV